MGDQTSFDKFYERAGDRKAWVVSASQLSDFAGTKYGCQRAWYAKRVLKLPQEQKERHSRGEVIHSVCERFNLADDTGRGPDGEAVDLYPKDWYRVFDRDGKLTYEMPHKERELTKAAVDHAIQEGNLVRMPQRMPEKEVWVPIIDTSEVLVEAVCFVDLASPREVIDYKTCLHPRNNKTKNNLVEEYQMLLYGKATNLLFPESPSRSLAHVYFVLDEENPRSRKVFTDPVPRKFFDDTLHTKILPLVEQMVKYRKKGKIDLADTAAWFGITGAREGSQACRFCAYNSICSSVETPEDYLQRLGGGGESQTHSRPTTEKKEASMGVFDKRTKKKSAAAAAGVKEPAPVNPPAEEPTEATSAAISTEPSQPKPAVAGAPPWANPSCVACGGRGFSTKNEICPACAAKCADTCGAPLAMFKVSAIDEEGFVHWAPDDSKGVSEDTLTALGCTNPSGSFLVKKPEPKPAPGAEPEEEPQAASVEVVETDSIGAEEIAHKELPGELSQIEVSPEVSGAKKARGRKTRTFTLCLGGAVPMFDHSGRAIYLDRLLISYGDQLAAVEGLDSFHDIDVWKRRGMMAKLASRIAETLKGTYVIARTTNPDVQDFASQLAPYADEIFGVSS